MLHRNRDFAEEYISSIESQMGMSTSFAVCKMYIFDSLSQFLTIYPRTNKQCEEFQGPQSILSPHAPMTSFSGCQDVCTTWACVQ